MSASVIGRRANWGCSPTPNASNLTLDAVKRLKMPVLVLRGETSNILTEDAASRFEAALSNATKVTVPSCGHNVHSQNTKGFLNAIEPFLAAQTQAPNRREEG